MLSRVATLTHFGLTRTGVVGQVEDESKDWIRRESQNMEHITIQILFTNRQSESYSRHG